MRRKTFLLLCIAFIALFIGISPLQAGHYYYKQISLKDGLPSTVRCILTDEQGFVWIGTRSGLGRYDGHELKKYVHQSNNPHSIPHNLIFQQRKMSGFRVENINASSVCSNPDFSFPFGET